jgi:hypothetical protein
MKQIESENTKPADASSCARAFSIIEDTLRIVRGKFKPGDVRAADLDPVRLAWTVKRFSQANRKTLRGLPGMQAAISVEAEVLEQKPEPSPVPRLPDLLPGNVTP